MNSLFEGPDDRAEGGGEVRMPRRRPPNFDKLKKAEPELPPKKELHPDSRVGKLVGVVSGKGGVGKSSVTALLAVALRRRGYRVAILDADVTGPSIPRMFGVQTKAKAIEGAILPQASETGIEIMSVNLLLENEGDPVVWRGPVVGGVVQQFWTDVLWQDIDIMLMDMPPGTGDVPLTIYQSLPVDGTVIVTTPQSLVNMVVTKSVRMAEIMDIPVLGIVENMSYFEAPDTGVRYKVFGESHLTSIAQAHQLDVLAELPINSEFTRLADDGEVERAAEVLSEQVVDGLAVTMMKKLGL